jgi:hypothetical protein
MCLELLYFMSPTLFICGIYSFFMDSGGGGVREGSIPARAV